MGIGFRWTGEGFFLRSGRRDLFLGVKLKDSIETTMTRSNLASCEYGIGGGLGSGAIAIFNNSLKPDTFSH